MNLHDDNEMIELFRKALWEVDRKQFDALSLEMRISDLGIDSVATFELIGYLEERFDIHLSDDQVATVRTLGDLAAIVRAG